MELITNIFPWGILATVIASAIALYKLGSDIRAIDAKTWNDMVNAQDRLQEQVTELSAELMLEQRARREIANELYAQMETMRAEYEKRIEMYQAQIDQMKREYEAKIRNLQKRIRELENGKGTYDDGYQ